MAKRKRLIPCQHIADYYQQAWEGHKCIAYNLLRQGYAAWAGNGTPIRHFNNLYRPRYA